MKLKQIVFWLCFFVVGIGQLESVLAKENLPEMPIQGLCAHRGEQKDFPENTLPAFAAAIERGARQLELDVCETKDGHLVIIHDPTVDRTTNGKGKVAELTFEEIRNLDAGSWKSEQFKGTKVPTFDEAIDSLPQNVWINVHLKSGKGLAERVALALKEKNRLHQAFLACSIEQIQEARNACPGIKVCNMSRQGDSSQYVGLTIAHRADFIQIVYSTETITVEGNKVTVPKKQYTKEDIARLKAAGVKINCFGTKNDPKALQEMLDDGIDFPLVDYLGDMMEVMKKQNKEPLQ